MQSKVKISQKEFDEIYEIEETVEDNTIEKEVIKEEESILTEEEQELEDKYLESFMETSDVD